MLTMPYRASGSCHDRNTERRGIPRHASGAARPRRPRAPFLWIAKERGERKLAPGDVPRAFDCDARRPTCADARARASRESHALAHAQKPRRPQAPARGKKTPRRPPHKNAPPLEVEVHIETFFTYTFYNDAARRVATPSEKWENRF